MKHLRTPYRLFIGALIVFVGIFALRTLYLRHAERETQEAIKLAPLPTGTIQTPSIEETSEGGRFRTGGAEHAQPGETTHLDEAETSSQKTIVENTTSVKKQPTPLEMKLLERGIDISKLPRGPNGELLKGATGGIALVPNPVAPTQKDIERAKKDRQLRECLAEIETELLKFPSDGTIGKEPFLKVLDLQEEKFRIERELGVQLRGTADPIIGVEIARHAMNVMTDEGIPVSGVPRFIELFEELGALELARLFRLAAENAVRNGEGFFHSPLEIQHGESDEP